MTTVKELRQSPDLPTSRGILSKGSSPNRGRRISFKESDTSVLKNPSQPDSFYEVLTAVKRIPHRLDSENQWSIEGTVVRAADNIVNHPNANLIDELKVSLTQLYTIFSRPVYFKIYYFIAVASVKLEFFLDCGTQFKHFFSLRATYKSKFIT